MSLLTRDMLPIDLHEYNYQVGFVLWERMARWKGCPNDEYLKATIWWRSVSKKKFLRKYFDSGMVSMISHPEDVLAVFHAGDVQRFGRRVFRVLKA
jgi:hypothetical protein